MDYSSSWINTSLDLNIKPYKVHEQLIPKNKVENNFFSLEKKKPSPKEESSVALVEELKRVSEENKKLTGMLTEMCENYNTLKNNLMEYMKKNPDNTSKKRKSDEISNSTISNPIMGERVHTNNSESSLSDEESFKKPKELIETCIKAKVSRVHYRTEPSDSSLIVKDGYQWRKYGQKVTRDNPSPRAYFKCSFAPSCPVKKKVQRSVDDSSVVVATYEGEHNHPYPSQMETATSGTNNNRCRNTSSSVVPNYSAPPTVPCSKNMMIDNPKMEVPQILVDQLASSLTKDLNFRAAIAAALSGKMLYHN